MFDYLRTQYVEDGDYYLTDIDRVFDSVATFSLYLTIALVVALLSVFIVMKLRKTENFDGFKKIVIGVAVGYSVSVIGLLGYLKLIYYIIDGKINTNFWLVVGLLGFVLISVIVGAILKGLKKKAFKPFLYIAFALAVAYLIVILCIIPAKKSSYEPLNKTGMYVFSAILISIIAVLTLIPKTANDYSDTKATAYAGVCIALSFALSYVKFFTVGAQGGSVTFASLLPLMIFAYKFGAKKGVLAGVVYGLLQFIQSPQFYQPMQALLDYPIAFSAIGLAGTFRKVNIKNEFVRFLLGATLSVLLRYVAHVLSGYYVFSSWAWEGYGPLAYSLVYNLFCFVDLAVLLVPAFVIFNSKSFTKALIGD